MDETDPNAGYTLVICEKPDAARRVAEALSEGKAGSSHLAGVEVFRFRRGAEELVVCSAQGHLYSVSDPFDERAVYPVFDAEWYPSNLVEDRGSNIARRIATIRKLAEGAGRFVNACDLDVEGETIGYNVLRYACGGEEKEAKRARFSTLTEEDLVTAFESARPQPGQGLAAAGRARHLLDFVWGVNLSRALSQSAFSSGSRYRTVSMGRVQGPALGFLVQREREVQGFVPVPYWRVTGEFRTGKARMSALYSEDRVQRKSEADGIRSDCLGREGVVTDASGSMVTIPPGPPFSIGDLQKEAFRVFRMQPRMTMQVAERLYLGALISYPRTGSQKLPPSINLGGILRGLSGMPRYAKDAAAIMKGTLKPVEGSKTDPAHPAIHPTGERPRRPLAGADADLYDLVVRRFLAAFAPPARRKVTSVAIAVGAHRFRWTGGTTVFAGWTSYYGRYWNGRDLEAPAVTEGDRLEVEDVAVEERFQERPPRYNQATLLEKMERENIGTKATRADVIGTLVERGYAVEANLVVTEPGLSVMEAMERHAPSIVTTELTRGMEQQLAAVEVEEAEGRDLLRGAVRTLAKQLKQLRAEEEEVGRDIERAFAASDASQVLGPCPVCRTGRLRVVRSRKTGKRFVGCTNYPGSCRASAPLPQKGRLKAEPRPCRHCSWPVIVASGGRRPWKLCVNPRCPSKGGGKDEVPAV